MALYLDLETTGLSSNDKIIEIAIVNDANEVCFHSLVNPDRAVPERISRLTGLSQTIFTESPRLEELLDELSVILRTDGEVVIYNAGFDTRFSPEGFWTQISVKCAREAFRRVAGGDGTLEVAARRAGYVWDESPHRAIPDARACRAVWRWAMADDQNPKGPFHNRTPSEIAEMAWDAHQQMKDAEEFLEKCKAELMKIAAGGKLSIEVPRVCKVSVSEPPKVSDKPSYLLVNDVFRSIDERLRDSLILSGAVKERKVSEEPRRPIVRFYPL